MKLEIWNRRCKFADLTDLRIKETLYDLELSRRLNAVKILSGHQPCQMFERNHLTRLMPERILLRKSFSSETGRECVDWLQLNKGWVLWLVRVNTVNEPSGSIKGGEIFD
jgi:hypothetical protein